MEADKERTQQIFRLYYDNVNVNEAVELMRGQNISAEVVKSIYDQLSANAEKLDRFHYYTTGVNNISYWTSRYLLAFSTKADFHEIKIIDLFNDKSIIVNVEKRVDELLNIYHLKDEFGLLEEYEYGNYFISLVSLDLDKRSLKKFHTVECYGTNICKNEADPFTFLIRDNTGFPNEWFSRICKIVEKKIIFDDTAETNFYPDCFYDKHIYGLKWYYEEGEELDIPQIYSYNVEEKTKNQFDLEAPVGYRINWGSEDYMRNNVFIELICPNNNRVIGCLNIETCQWNVLDLYFNLSRSLIDWFEEGNLVIRIRQSSKAPKKYRFYKISFGQPELLENMAWFSLVKVMKNSYEAARKYLPPNSSINCPFDRPDEPKEKRSKLE